jgi:integrase/recombinase XerD
LPAISINPRNSWDRRISAPTPVYLTNERKLAPGSVLIAVAELRFLYKVSLHKDWTFEDVIPAPKKPQKLPIVLSPEEVLQFLSSVGNIKHRAILTTCYAAGLRISEAVHLQPVDIDKQRMVIRVDKGKGRKDRCPRRPFPVRYA